MTGGGVYDTTSCSMDASVSGWAKTGDEGTLTGCASELCDASAFGAGVPVVAIGRSPARGCMRVVRCVSCPKGRGTYCRAAEVNALSSEVSWLRRPYGKKLKIEEFVTLGIAGIAGESIGVSWLLRRGDGFWVSVSRATIYILFCTRIFVILLSSYVRQIAFKF